jgi:ectoine hydroxylase-related dioxygenase (phytanoyl-CoA dioxygenase family)
MITKGHSFSIEQYKEQGYCGPIQGLTLEEAEVAYNRFFDTLGQSKYNPSPTSVDLSAWHQKHRWAYDLATHPSIVETITNVLGDNVLLWAMHFWYKEPGNDKFIPWHQDINYWPMEPAINATAWVTLGFSIQENGCIKFIPGTHTLRVEHSDMGNEQSAFAQGIAADRLDESKAIHMEMSPGQMVFFNEAIFHGSEPNSSNIPRVAFSVRYTVPEVKFNMEAFGGNKERIKTYLVKGEDNYHYNDAIVGTPPQD